MRIIAGSRARMTLLPPKDRTTRPITDRVKESLFGILGPRSDGARVADLFCGTGSLGLEALSRGAAWAIMVDRDRDALQRLRRNIAQLGFEAGARVHAADIFRVGIPEEPTGDARCDLVFVDPPYRCSEAAGLDSPLGRLLLRLGQQAAPAALLVVRHDRHSDLLEAYGPLTRADYREYGNMALTFLENGAG